MAACREYETLRIGRLAESLTLPEARRLEEHIGKCADCSAEVKRLDATRAALALPPMDATELKALEEIPGSTIHLWRRTEQGVRRRRMMAGGFAIAAAAAAVLLVLVMPHRSRVPNRTAASQSIMLDEWDEPLTIAEPMSAALVDSELVGGNALADASLENEMTLDDLGDEL